ncbi:hypothetical protein DPMN_144117 [Dreissena polymorpha]|uniref:Uncharacterized protein n=1 Tax=Dreissena polymorpha TaxID=45954 RepID=A0A9D4GEB0_DREPO|nr:hypothetical protein DPMN_144117 [Dreissena polymorpha]
MLRSVNISEFTTNIITQLTELCPQPIIRHGTPHIHTSNLNIKVIIEVWTSDTNIRDWDVVYNFTRQLKKNTNKTSYFIQPATANYYNYQPANNNYSTNQPSPTATSTNQQPPTTTSNNHC